MKQTGMVLMSILLLSELAMANPRGIRESGKSTTESARQTKQHAEEAARRALFAAHDPATLIRTLETQQIGHLSPTEKRDLVSVMVNDGVAKSAVQQILSQASNTELSELNSARLQAISYLKDMPSDASGSALAAMSMVARAEQAYATLALEAGAKATTWSPELRSNLSFVLSTANQLVARGQSRGEALLEAAKELEQVRGVRLEIDKIKALCK